jgi:hypothetical protein
VNWLGWSTRAMLGALAGIVLGGVLYAYLLARGWDAPFAVGVLGGLGAFLLSPDRSGLRALLVTTMAIWGGAIAQSFAGPYRGIGVLGFHDTLTPTRFALYCASGLAAFLLARSSIRRDARKRTAGA